MNDCDEDECPNGILDASLLDSRTGAPSFSFGNRLFRVAWNIAWRLFASWTPPQMRRYRIALIKIFGGKVSWKANVYSSVRIWHPMNLVMCDYSCLGPNTNCYCMATITLEEHAIVSQGAHLCTGTHDVDDEHFQLFAKPITIQVGAWIAAEAFVGPGVTIRRRSVVGARSVVFKDTEENTIYVGNPATALRQRIIPTRET